MNKQEKMGEFKKAQAEKGNQKNSSKRTIKLKSINPVIFCKFSAASVF